MKKIFLFLVIFSFFQAGSVFAETKDGVVFIVKSSGEAVNQSVLTAESSALLKGVKEGVPTKRIEKFPPSDSYFLYEDEPGILKTIVKDESGRFFELQSGREIEFPAETRKEILNYLGFLREKHYGEFVSWEEAEQLFPRYASFKITDLETGRSFYVQRRAGSHHADVQPLTEKDTAIMKEIYNGKWSWKRRAVLVHGEGEDYAGSMHGMPHGAGALSNGFPGHFCIHFKGSTTHTSGKEDLSHQAMVHKAGGSLFQFLRELPAEEIVNLFFISLNQNDLDLLRLIYNGDKDVSTLKGFIRETESVRIIEQSPINDNQPLVYETTVKYRIKKAGRGEETETFTFRAVRESPASEWKLEKVPSPGNSEEASLHFSE